MRRLVFRFAEQHKVKLLPIGHPAYPSRLLQCEDAPLVLYYKGEADLNAAKTAAIIGTRKNTDYGQRCTEGLVEALASIPDLLIVSGLALGIDTLAHRSALRHSIPTIGVLGHGLDKLYPATNAALAREMLTQGGLLTDFPAGTRLSPQNFPVRNRIVAGLCDVTIVVESDVKGGAMITASVALGYHREVAAFPGRIYDGRSEGPNFLIRKNMASLIRGADDLLELMNWQADSKQPSRAVQARLFATLSEDEQTIVNLLKDKDTVHTDELMHRTGFAYPHLASVLLNLEMQDLIKSLPGKIYRIN